MKNRHVPNRNTTAYILDVFPLTGKVSIRKSKIILITNSFFFIEDMSKFCFSNNPFWSPAITNDSEAICKSFLFVNINEAKKARAEFKRYGTFDGNKLLPTFKDICTTLPEKITDIYLYENNLFKGKYPLKSVSEEYSDYFVLSADKTRNEHSYDIRIHSQPKEFRGQLEIKA